MNVPEMLLVFVNDIHRFIAAQRARAEAACDVDRVITLNLVDAEVRRLMRLYQKDPSP